LRRRRRRRRRIGAAEDRRARALDDFLGSQEKDVVAGVDVPVPYSVTIFADQHGVES
jgi:hypothetical protein